MSEWKKASLARLYASKQKYAETQYAEGVLLGITWARNGADYVALKRIADIYVKGYLGERDLAVAILGEPDVSAESEVLEEIFGTKMRSTEVVSGFIEGAVEMLEEVS